MLSQRDASLPDGLKDLVDLIERQKQADQTEKLIETSRRKSCLKLVPILVQLLSQRIDQDLFNTREQELIAPKIREVVSDYFDKNAPGLPSDIKSKMVEILTEQIWRHIRPDVVREALAKENAHLSQVRAQIDRYRTERAKSRIAKLAERLLKRILPP